MSGVNGVTGGTVAYNPYMANPQLAQSRPGPAASAYAAADSLSLGYARQTTPFGPVTAPRVGIVDRVRQILGLPPRAQLVPIANPSIFDRIKSFFGFGPPIQPVTGNAAGASFPQQMLNFFTGGPNHGVDTRTATSHSVTVTPQQLKELGQRQDKTAFFQALLPAAIAAERAYGVPASVTLAQAALESGWARSPIGGYNIFGIKGRGSAGSTMVDTHEVRNGRRVAEKDRFALYRDFDDAMMAHGRLFHNGYYDKGVREFAQNRDPYRFVDNIAGRYATDPRYAQSIKGMMRTHNLVAMARAMGGN